LNVPVGRLQEQQGFSIGRSVEISRDEIKFHKFIGRLRKKFANLFTDALFVQLVAKNIIRPDEWEDLKQDIKYDFIEDNHYSELKDNEILNTRLATLQLVEPYIGKFYSMDWIRKNILQMNEQEIEEMNKQMEKDGDIQMQHAELDGSLAAAAQAAQQNFLQANAPQALEAPTDNQQGVNQ
jgi:hypothetical protein